MTATNKNFQGAGQVKRNRPLVLLAWLGLTASTWASAENVLQDIRYVPGDAGSVEIALSLSEPGVDAQVFTTDTPPRIAIDLPDTRNGLVDKRIQVGSGATSAISAVEAAGRTRVVVDLFRATSYETRMDGNTFVINVSGGAAVAVAAPTTTIAMGSEDPAKRLPGTIEVANVDFRRTNDGAGRVILTFSGEGAAADMRTEGQRIVVDLPGVQVPSALVQRLDVVDFATPVQFVETTDAGGSAMLTVSNNGPFESMAYQSGNEYVIEISPPPPVVEGAVEGIEEEGYTGKPVTFNFQDIPVRTVLQLIAEESGLNVVAADTVSGNVTLRLINVPWDQALDIVLRAKGLDQRRDGNVVWVAPQAELASYERAQAEARLAAEVTAPLTTEYIQINYARAEDIASLLTEELKSGSGGGGGGGGSNINNIEGVPRGALTRGFLSQRGTVTFDPRTNTILLNDTQEKIDEIKQLIVLLDRPVDQVLIEAKVVIAAEDFARELGARFGVTGAYQDGDGNILTTTGTGSGAGGMAEDALFNRSRGQAGLPVSPPGQFERFNVNLPLLAPAGQIGFALLGADYLIDLELSALESEGRGEIVSSPRVITANQREATIRQGDEFGFITASGTGINQTTNVQFKEALLELKVTPTITKDGRVFLDLLVTKNDITSFTDQGELGRVPNLTKRDVSTAVLVDNGQTVVVGGVYEFNSQEDVSKVPFLGDVPVLGNLFKRKGRTTGKAELLIFVTPKIMVVPGRSE